MIKAFNSTPQGKSLCFLLMFSLPSENWVRLAVYLIGLAIYGPYGRHHSVMAKALAHEISKHGVSPAGMPVTHIASQPDDQLSGK